MATIPQRIRDLQKEKLSDRAIAAVLGIDYAAVVEVSRQPATAVDQPILPQNVKRIALGDFDLTVGWQENDGLYYRLDGTTFPQADFPPDVDGTVVPENFIAVTCGARCSAFDTDLGEADAQSVSFGVFVRNVPDGQWGVTADLSSGPAGNTKTTMNIGQVAQVPAIEYCAVFWNSSGEDREVSIRDLDLLFYII